MTDAKFNEEVFNQNYKLLEEVKEDATGIPPSSETILADCVDVTVSGNKVCLELPLNIGRSCISIPVRVPNGTVAQACISICRTGRIVRIPCGVAVYVKVAGIEVASQKWGCC